jgi:hypothetical protein
LRFRDPAVWALVGSTALPIAVFALPGFIPSVDLPQHVAAAQLLLHLRQPDLARLYEARLFPQVDVLALFVGAPLHALLPEAAAIRVFFGLIFAALAWSLLRLTRAGGGSVWGAVTAMLFAVHFDLWYGFLSFCLGIPVLLWLLARWTEAGWPGASSTGSVPADSSNRPFASDAALWLLLVLAHTLLFAFALAAFALWQAQARVSRRQRVRRCLAIVPAAIWVVACWLQTRSALDRWFPSSDNHLAFLWEGPAAKRVDFGRSLIVAGTDGRIEWIVLALVGAFVVWRFTSMLRAGNAPTVTSPRRFLGSIALLGVVAYVLLPYSIYQSARVTYGLFILYQRFLVLAPLIVLPVLPWPSASRARTAAIATLCVSHALLAANLVRLRMSVDREAQGLDAAIASLPPGARIKSLIYTPYPEALRFEVFLHAASYYQARKRGETDQSFALLVPNPIHYRDPLRPYLSRQDEHLHPETFDWRQASRYDALLVYDASGTAGAPPAGEVRASFADHGWAVLEP